MTKKYYEICIDHNFDNPVSEYATLNEVYEQIKIYKDFDKKEGTKTIYTIFEINNGERVLHSDNV